ncbi:MAG TPA: hypothetical protein EYP57_04155 [Thermodesulfobacteriaceae bacterium]|nr:hypothetical protein [Thermodesulfobacteriaceae bacterium]
MSYTGKEICFKKAVSKSVILAFSLFFLNVNQSVMADQDPFPSSHNATFGYDVTEQPSVPDPSLFSYAFPDVPVPVELAKIEDQSMTIQSPGFMGGVVIFKGRVTGASLADFFKTTMPQRGWNLLGTIDAKKKYLSFVKGNNGHCLIKINEGSFFSKTIVEIWLTQPVVK